MTITAIWRTSGAQLYIATEAGALTLSFAGQENYSFDGEGRLVGAWRNKITYRRALDNRILAKWIDPARPAQRVRRFLDLAERQSLLDWVYSRAATVAESLVSGQLGLAERDHSALEPIAGWLTRVTGWTWPRLEAEAQRFAAVYKPVPILPPDQYMAAVIQATEGCSYNECSFCTFYRDRLFRIKRQDDFERHVDDVLNFLGRGLTLRRKLFLADANAVIIAQASLLPMLDHLNALLPILPAALDPAQQRDWQQMHPGHFDGIYAFISAPDALRKSAAEFARLKQRNLRRVYVGLESGHDPLRRFLHKQGSAADVLDAVHTIKQGGLNVGLICMVGVGGEKFRQAHGEDTVALIQRMPLDAGDLIYLSPFVDDGRTPYSQQTAAASVTPLSEEAIERDEMRLKAALLPWAQVRGVRISHYDIREFVY
jgi:hypothetical protein